MSLLAKRCIPCEKGTIPLFRPAAETLLREIPGWELSGDAKKISRKYKFRNFKEALVFVNAIGAIAEEEGHHPDIALGWGKVTIELLTHAIGGLSENDFILAAKINEMG
jgi:4a-hydroxytetrahydrobiopterin dehydratase